MVGFTCLSCGYELFCKYQYAKAKAVLGVPTEVQSDDVFSRPILSLFNKLRWLLLRYRHGHLFRQNVASKASVVHKIDRGMMCKGTMMETFTPEAVRRWFNRSTISNARLENFEALAGAPDGFSMHVADEGPASYLCNALEARFWRRMAKAFPELIDIMCTQQDGARAAVQQLIESMYFFFECWELLVDKPTPNLHTVLRRCDSGAVLNYLFRYATDDDRRRFSTLVNQLLPAYKPLPLVQDRRSALRSSHAVQEVIAIADNPELQKLRPRNESSYAGHTTLGSVPASVSAFTGDSPVAPPASGAPDLCWGSVEVVFVPFKGHRNTGQLNTDGVHDGGMLQEGVFPGTEDAAAPLEDARRSVELPHSLSESASAVPSSLPVPAGTSHAMHATHLHVRVEASPEDSQHSPDDRAEDQGRDNDNSSKCPLQAFGDRLFKFAESNFKASTPTAGLSAPHTVAPSEALCELTVGMRVVHPVRGSGVVHAVNDDEKPYVIDYGNGEQHHYSIESAMKLHVEEAPVMAPRQLCAVEELEDSKELSIIHAKRNRRLEAQAVMRSRAPLTPKTPHMPLQHNVSEQLPLLPSLSELFPSPESRVDATASAVLLLQEALQRSQHELDGSQKTIARLNTEAADSQSLLESLRGRIAELESENAELRKARRSATGAARFDPEPEMRVRQSAAAVPDEQRPAAEGSLMSSTAVVGRLTAVLCRDREVEKASKDFERRPVAKPAGPRMLTPASSSSASNRSPAQEASRAKTLPPREFDSARAASPDHARPSVRSPAGADHVLPKLQEPTPKDFAHSVAARVRQRKAQVGSERERQARASQSKEHSSQETTLEVTIVG